MKSMIIAMILVILQFDYHASLTLKTNLKLVQLMYRHGDRSPLGQYPTDPHNITIWDKYGGLGQLTQTGMKQLKDLGKYLRKLYNDFLGPYYNAKNVYAMSTDYDRTIMSTLSLLSGLYSPAGFQKFDDSISWQPIPVHMNNDKAKNAFYPELGCPRLDAYRNEIFQLDVYKKVADENQDLTKMVGEKIGEPNFSFRDLLGMSDILFVEKSHNLKFPDWISDEVYTRIVNMSNQGAYFSCYTTEMAKLATGGVLNDMTENIKAKINGSLNKIYLYGAHDSYIAAYTKLLNISTYINQPPYASAILVELLESADTVGDYYVQIYLKNNTADQPISFQPMTIYGCDELCPYKKFLNIIEPLVVRDFKEECKLDTKLERTKRFIKNLISSLF